MIDVALIYQSLPALLHGAYVTLQIAGLGCIFGITLGTLLGFAAVMGFGGAFISLLMSKPMAKWSTGAVLINDSADPTHQWLVRTVAQFAQKAGGLSDNIWGVTKQAAE